jgi:hypothetical protein
VFAVCQGHAGKGAPATRPRQGGAGQQRKQRGCPQLLQRRRRGPAPRWLMEGWNSWP